MSGFFERTKNRMPHFFQNVDVLEYMPHNKSKSISHLFFNTRYYVIDPKRNDLSSINDNFFNVAMSIDYFQHVPNYLDQFKQLQRVSSKFVMFSCAAPGTVPKTIGNYYQNLTMSDFYNTIDVDSMFESYVFEPDYEENKLYFWGVKRRNEV